MFSDTFKIINSIRRELCDMAAQGANYKGWTDEYARKEIREVIFNEASPFRKHYLSPTMIVHTIHKRAIAVADADTDTRYGVCAWGFYHEKSKAARNG